MDFSKINELEPYDLNCNIFDVYSYNGLSMQELLCQFFTKINECIKTSNETIDLAEWLVNEGLKQEVALKLTIWLNDGTLENIINVTLFENLNNKIDNVSSQLEHIEKHTSGYINVENYIHLVKNLGEDNEDWYEAIQTAIDYAYDNDIFEVKFANREYKISYPLIVKVKIVHDWWTSPAIKLIGHAKSVAKIRKTNNNTLAHTSSEINNIDSALILFTQSRNGQENYGGRGAGVSIENLTIINDSTNLEAKAITGNASNRIDITNVDILSNKGIIFDLSFSSRFRNIVINCKEDALVIKQGTSNLFEFIYAPSCHNPYTIQSSYTNMLSVCSDDATGIIFNVNGNGLVMSGCGCESPKAQYIVNCYYEGRNINTATITSLYCFRQTGDNGRGLKSSDCAIFRSLGYVRVQSLDILNHQYIGENNSYLLETVGDFDNSPLSVGSIAYYKNYSGKDCPPLLYSKQKASNNTYGKINTDGTSINIRRNMYMPYLGSRGTEKYLSTGFIDKAIYLDNINTTVGSDGNDRTYEQAYNVGDVLLSNNPKTSNSLGWVTTAKNGDFVGNNTFAPIPISLVGPTEDRPTENLYTGLQYFDTTLWKPIWCKYPISKIWVDCTGNQV